MEGTEKHNPSVQHWVGKNFNFSSNRWSYVKEDILEVFGESSE